MSATLMLLGLLAATPDPMTARDESDWTPHSAAALLDAGFGSAVECQQQLDRARARVSHAPPVHGLSYDRLFAQGRCEAEHAPGASPQPAGPQGEIWRIRMHWPRVRRAASSQTPPVKTTSPSKPAHRP